MEPSNVLLDKLQRGTLDFVIGRIQEGGGGNALVYEELNDEPACALVRPGHPLLEREALQLEDIAALPWIVPPHGSILRHRFDMMFWRAGLQPPANVVETTALLVITALLQETDSLHVMPREVAQYYASLNVMRILPIDLPCKMDAFGIIRLRDRLPSPGADLLFKAVRDAAAEIY
jgi:DNA-binding transcriptional LysR family regulator